MTNLLEETEEIMKQYNLKRSDICFVGAGDQYMLWPDFVRIAKTINYDNGFGIQEIRSDLVIVGSYWWLKRAEYDGSEWWEFEKRPKMGTHLVTDMDLIEP